MEVPHVRWRFLRAEPRGKLKEAEKHRRNDATSQCEPARIRVSFHLDIVRGRVPNTTYRLSNRSLQRIIRSLVNSLSLQLLIVLVG